MDYYKRYQEIVGEYNREKDRATVEETFAKLVALAGSLDEEQQRAAREGLTEEELALFDLLYEERVSKGDKERLKQSSKLLLAAIQQQLAFLNRWTDREQTKAEVKVFVLDRVYQALPIPPYTERQVQEAADGIYDFVWQQSSGRYS
jgi:type I restriction enzyme R subunit